MIRMNPAHDTVNPPGCQQPGREQENVQHQEKPLNKEIDLYKKGFDDGVKYQKKCLEIFLKRSSEFDR